MRFAGFKRLAILLIVLLASCAPQPVPVTPTLSIPTATPSRRATEIRFALIGNVTDVNVWALFDEAGQSYNNYAVRNEYWPRLYRLSIPDGEFEAMAAQDMPSEIAREGDIYIGTVTLRSDLSWTDGAPFTADDVAFTVNTALNFQLGFDWKAYYNYDYLARAEAVDLHTVKFYFKKQPNVGFWQYGALMGPIVQRKYWDAKISSATALLPDEKLRADISKVLSEIDAARKDLDQLSLELPTLQPNSDTWRASNSRIKQLQNDLDGYNNQLQKWRDESETKIVAARNALYSTDHKDEPTLGNWIPAGIENGAWVNEVNPKYPFDHPNFARTRYRLFASEDEAIDALIDNQIDAVLNSNGLSEKTLTSGKFPSVARLVHDPDQFLRFLVVNTTNPVLADNAVRQALSCALNRNSFAGELSMGGISLESFALPDDRAWYNAEAIFPCKGADEEARLLQAVQILKSAGYSWDQEPASNLAGNGLRMPNGKPFPAIILLAPLSSSDVLRTIAANIIQQQALMLGIPITIKYVTTEELRYSVFSSGQYDMAILGWRVSEYPGYLCEWFGAGNPFQYNGNRLKSECEALNKETDLESARKHVFKIQAILADDLPFIPLYSGITYDAYRNISYPFDHLPGGMSGVYGAPSLANPSQ